MNETLVPSPAVAGQRRLPSSLVSLQAAAARHPAVDHPWLVALAAGTLPDPAWSVRDFAAAYCGYSQWFPRYLQAVIDRLPDPGHRALLAENLAEEKGELHPEDREALIAAGIAVDQVEGVAHARLFRDFCRKVGVTAEELAKPRPAAVRWRERFLRALENGTPAFCVGALGLGTEGVVRAIYQKLLAGIRRATALPRRDYVFFELHCLVDDQHHKDLLRIAGELATVPGGTAQLAAGMEAALTLRAEFWDHLLERSLRRGQLA